MGARSIAESARADGIAAALEAEPGGPQHGAEQQERARATGRPERGGTDPDYWTHLALGRALRTPQKQEVERR